MRPCGTQNKASLFEYIGIVGFWNLFNIVTTTCYLDLQPLAKPDLLPDQSLPVKKKTYSEDKLDVYVTQSFKHCLIHTSSITGYNQNQF